MIRTIGSEEPQRLKTVLGQGSPNERSLPDPRAPAVAQAVGTARDWVEGEKSASQPARGSTLRRGEPRIVPPEGEAIAEFAGFDCVDPRDAEEPFASWARRGADRYASPFPEEEPVVERSDVVLLGGAPLLGAAGKSGGRSVRSCADQDSSRSALKVGGPEVASREGKDPSPGLRLVRAQAADAARPSPRQGRR